MTQDMKKNKILHTIAQRLVRHVRTLGTSHANSQYVPHVLKTVLLLLMMVVGVSGVWGEDYSGTYYIGVPGTFKQQTDSPYATTDANDRYYLCPTEGWLYYEYKDSKDDCTTTDNGQPFLTTFQCRNGIYDVDKAMWTIEYNKKEGGKDYYHIKHTIDGKYLVCNKGINGSNSANRIRVHLKKIESPSTLNDSALFAITKNDNGYYFIEAKTAGNNNKYMNVTEGNSNSLAGASTKKDGPKTYNDNRYVGGTVGLWEQQNETSQFYFEKIAPKIVYTNNNLIEITYLGYPDNNVTIYYTTDGSSPSASNGTTYNNTPFDPNPSDDETVNSIKAIAVLNDEESDVATYKTVVLLGSTHPRLIQSQHYNTDKVTWTEPCYYMIPGDVSSENMTVNTTTLLQPTMEWYFRNAGKDDLSGNYSNQYYYIVNSNGENLCYDSTNGVHLETNSDNADKFKFSIAPYPTTGTPTDYNLLPYGLTSGNRFINKNSGNDNVAPLNLGSTNNASASRWKFIKKTDLNTTPPFSVSDANNIYYYKLSTNATPAAFITPPASGNYVTTNTTESTNQNWYFEQAESSTSSDWLTYYHIRNAITGEYLYYNGEVNSSTHTNAFELHSSIDNNTADCYMFAVARATIKDRWYIIPKVLKETQFANISTIWRDNNNALKTQATRNNGNAMWQFTISNFCMPPVFVEGTNASNEKIITLSCPTNGAEIHFTDNGAEPTDESALYENGWVSSAQHSVKAIAVVKTGETVTASSAVVTLLNKPDIELKEGTDVVDDDTYTYSGTAKTPTPSKVYIGTTETTTGFALDATTPYSNNTNAGTATVKVIDNDATDTWYIMNASTTFTINKKNLTATADDKNVTYGDAVPTYTASYTGFVNGETDPGFTTQPTISCNYTVTSEVSSSPYTITVSGGVAPNYVIETYNNGSLTVNQKEVVLVWGSSSFGYDGQNHKPTVTVTNAVNDDVIGVTVTGEQTNAGDYTATASELSGAKKDNYKLPTDNTHDFSIAKRLVTVSGITASNKTYDGTTTATLTTTGVSFGNIVENDALTVTGTGVFDTKDAGLGKTVNISGLTLDGASKNNYDLDSEGQQTETTADISPLTAELSWNTPLIYNGTPQVPTATITNLVSGDECIVTTSVEGDHTNASTNNYTANLSIDNANYALPYGTYDYTIGPKSLIKDDAGTPADDITIDITTNEDTTNPYTITVKYGENITLEEGEEKDYVATIPEADGAVYDVTITGHGNYTGTAKAILVNMAQFDDTTPDDPSQIETATVYCASQNLQATDDVEAWYVTAYDFNNREVTIKKVESDTNKKNYIPADCPVLLLGAASTKGFMLKPYSGDEMSFTEPNLLKKAVGTETVVNLGDVYIYYKGEFVLSKPGTIKAGKYYIGTTSSSGGGSSPAPAFTSLRIVKSESATKMGEIIDNSQHSDVWYTLDGQKLSKKPTRKGIYILNSKKLIVK